MRVSKMVIAAVLALGLVVSAEAQLLVEESFEYDVGPGALVGNSGGTGWGGAWYRGATGPTTDGSDIVAGLTHHGLVTSGNAAFQEVSASGYHRDQMRRTLMTDLPGDRDQLWFSQLIRVIPEEEGGDYPDGANRWLGTKYYPGGSSSEFWYGHNYNKTTWGMERPPGTDSAVDIVPGETTLLVMKIELDHILGIADKYLWVNPDPSTFGGVDLDTLTADLAIPDQSVSSFTMQRIELDGGTCSVMDEIRIGESYADVTPTPEPTTMSLLGLGALALLARRRRRKA